MKFRYIVLVFFIGLTLLSQPAYQTYTYYQEQSTVTTEGEVLTADYERVTDGRVAVNDLILDVRYRYEYNGETYERPYPNEV